MKKKSTSKMLSTSPYTDRANYISTN